MSTSSFRSVARRPQLSQSFQRRLPHAHRYHATRINASSTQTRAESTVNPDEIALFSKLSSQWWDEQGECKMLHRMNPVRVQFIREKMVTSYTCIILHDALTNPACPRVLAARDAAGRHRHGRSTRPPKSPRWPQDPGCWLWWRSPLRGAPVLNAQTQRIYPTYTEPHAPRRAYTRHRRIRLQRCHRVPARCR